MEMESKNSNATKSPVQKRNYMEDFVPLYKKLWEREAEKNSKTPSKPDLSNSKECERSSKSTQKKQALDVCRINIDGTSLNSEAGGSSPLNESKITSTPLANFKKQTKSTSKFKKNASAIEHNETSEDLSGILSKSKSQKRSKSVSFMLEENDQQVIKKPKSDDSLDGESGDMTDKVKKHKKNKKLEKENKCINEEMTVDEPAQENKVKKNKKKYTSKSEETSVQSNPDYETDQGDNVANLNRRTNKAKKQEKSPNTELTEVVEKQKAKKQKHNDMPDQDSEPASKTSKTEVIADNLEKLKLGDNTHTLTNLINEMTVVDKAKKKNIKKAIKKEKKQINKQNEAGDQNKKHTDAKTNHGNETGDSDAGDVIIKKKWLKKRWNKQQLAERHDNKTLNVDNLPVSLLKNNYKKILNEHFSKNGFPAGVGEAFIVDEQAPDPVFTTKVYFHTEEAVDEALAKLDKTTIEGNEIRLSRVYPKTETTIVLRLLNPREKLNADDIRTTFTDVGLIRSIRKVHNKRKNIFTTFVEFSEPDVAQRALAMCIDIKINGASVRASPYILNQKEGVESKKKKRQRNKKASKVSQLATNEESELDKDIEIATSKDSIKTYKKDRKNASGNDSEVASTKDSEEASTEESKIASEDSDKALKKDRKKFHSRKKASGNDSKVASTKDSGMMSRKDSEEALTEDYEKSPKKFRKMAMSKDRKKVASPYLPSFVHRKGAPDKRDSAERLE